MADWIQIIHVISAAILFGTGIATALYWWQVNQQSDVQLIATVAKQVVVANCLFVGTAAVVQFITGIVLIYLKGYSPTAVWIMGGFTGYFIAGFCWLIVVYFQIRCRALACDAARNHRLVCADYNRCYRMGCLFAVPAYVALIVVLYLMANQTV